MKKFKTSHLINFFIYPSISLLIGCAIAPQNGFVSVRTQGGGTFTGELRNGFYHGKGTDYLSNGDKYEGEFLGGKRNGQGSYTSANGDKYVGEFINDQIVKGTFFFLANNQFKGDKYEGEFKYGKFNGKGQYTSANGNKYIGNFENNVPAGNGEYIFANGGKFIGEFREGKYNGQGILSTPDGKVIEGIWENNNLIREAKVNLPNIRTRITTDTELAEIEKERQQLAHDRRKLEEEKRQQESNRINLQVTHTQPNTDGFFSISINTNTNTKSLQIDNEEQGSREDGKYLITRMARAGQETSVKITATDTNGNIEIKSINVKRVIIDSKPLFAALNPSQVKKQPERDAVAVIIGIADYKSLPKAEFSNEDARTFYDYAVRALGVKPENIKLLVDSDAEEAEIIKTFRTWLPSRVRSTTDVYVFYSGHGFPTADGQGIFLIPPRADRDVIDETAIPFNKINTSIQSAKPKSVTVFMDACYSGQTRGGETLIANARPISIKSEKKLFPESFTIISASQSDQISSSSPDLKHGIFSYYLMKGMEGNADLNNDGKITLGEMQIYLSENVRRQAGMLNRKQDPQISGDLNKTLIGK